MVRRFLCNVSKAWLLSLAYFVLSGCVGTATYAVSRPVSESSNVNISWQGRLKLGDTVMFVSPANAVEIKNGTVWLIVIPVIQDVPANELFFIPGYYRTIDPRNPGTFVYGLTPGFFIFEIFFDTGKHSIEFAPAETVLHHHGKEWRPVNSYDLVKNLESTGSLLGHYRYEDDLCVSKEKGFYFTLKEPGQAGRFLEVPLGNPLITPEKSGAPTKIKGLGVPKKMLLSRNTKYCLALEFPVNPPDPREDEFTIEINGLRIDDKNVPLRIKYVPDTTTHRLS